MRREPSQAGEDAGTQVARPPDLLKVPTVASRRREWGGEPVSAWKLLGWREETAPHGGTPLLALLPWCLAHSPTLLTLAGPLPTLSGSLPTEPPTSTRTDSGPSQKSRRDRAREKTLLSSSVGSGQGLRWGLAEVKMAPWFPCGRWEEAQAVVCCSQREGPDLAWSAWPGWGLGASGCLLGARPALSPGPHPGQDSSL